METRCLKLPYGQRAGAILGEDCINRSYDDIACVRISAGLFAEDFLCQSLAHIYHTFTKSEDAVFNYSRSLRVFLWEDGGQAAEHLPYMCACWGVFGRSAERPYNSNLQTSNRERMLPATR